MQDHLQRLLAVCSALVLAACTGTRNSADGDAVRPYPLDTCIVTENALGSMGDPIVKVYDGQEIKFCCKPCVAEFEGSQAEFLKKLPK